jgi:hypothetical protein
MGKLGALTLVRGLRRCWLVLTGRAAATIPGKPSGTVKRAASLALLVLATFSLASAQVPDCAPGKLSDYEMLGAQGCAVGENRFSSFRYHQGSSGLPSSAISITPGTSPDNDDPGMLFEAKWVAPSQQSSVSYMIDVQPKGKPISGATLQMQFGEITGAGEAKVETEICPLAASADNCGAAELKLQVVLSTGPARKVSDTGQLNGSTRQLRVVHLLSVAAGKGGTASFNGFMAVFHRKAP